MLRSISRTPRVYFLSSVLAWWSASTIGLVASLLTVAQGADEGDDVKAELAVGQGPCAFFFGANRLAVTRAGGIVAAADAEGQAGDMLKGGDGARGIVASPECAPTA